eukprot:Ihof_evm2s665 gene=Ihof_evmTU2s665
MDIHLSSRVYVTEGEGDQHPQPPNKRRKVSLSTNDNEEHQPITPCHVPTPALSHSFSANDSSPLLPAPIIPPILLAPTAPLVPSPVTIAHDKCDKGEIGLGREGEGKREEVNGHTGEWRDDTTIEPKVQESEHFQHTTDKDVEVEVVDPINEQPLSEDDRDYEDEEDSHYAHFRASTLIGPPGHSYLGLGLGANSDSEYDDDDDDDHDFIPGDEPIENYYMSNEERERYVGLEGEGGRGQEGSSGRSSVTSSSEDDKDLAVMDPQEEAFYRSHALAWIIKRRDEGVEPETALVELGIDVMQRRFQTALRLAPDDLWFAVEMEVRKLFRFYYRQLPKSVTHRPEETGPPRLSSLSLEGIAAYIASGACKNIVMVTGAGISTAAGIPDFRSPGTGLYHNLQKYNVPYPQAIFEIDFFKINPAPFVMLSKELYPGRYKPTISHYFSRLLMEKGLLRRHYTQNIDTLERMAGIDGDLLVEAHGSFNTAHCIMCKKAYKDEYVKDLIFADYIPTCSDCQNWVKPDIVFFGEGLPKYFSECAEKDFIDCDLVIVAGTSLKVQPFASIIDMVPHDCPRLLINRELCGEAPSLYQILGFRAGFEFSRENNVRDVAVTGTCDDGFLGLAHLLGWKDELLELLHGEHERLAAIHTQETERLASGNHHDISFYEGHVPVSTYRRAPSRPAVIA